MPIPADFDPSSFDPADLCDDLELDVELFGLSILLPGGIELSAQVDGIPHPGDVAAKLLGEVNAALAPLSPFFDVIDLLLVLKDVFDAVKSLNPFQIGSILPKLYKKIDKLKKLIPQLSIPASLKKIIRVLLVLIRGIRLDLEAIIRAQSNIDLSAQRASALGSAGALVLLECATADAAVLFQVVQQQAAPLNRLLGVLALFTSLAGIDKPEIPSSINFGENAEEATASLKSLEDALQALHDAIPI